jgi:DNA-binding transcriptional regulator YhcF (GntR family)
MIAASIDADSAVPPFEQLRSQLAAAIRAGLLVHGTRLPPIRQLAGDLALAPNTVARAYRELEGAGLVEGRGRRGTVVTRDAETEPPTRLAEAARIYLAQAGRLGLTLDEAVSVLRMIS